MEHTNNGEAYIGQEEKKRTFLLCPGCNKPRWTYSKAADNTDYSLLLCRGCTQKAAAVKTRRRTKKRKRPYDIVKKTNGSVVIYLPPSDKFFSCSTNGRMYEHRHKMMIHLNRPLTDRETVRHKNGDRSDNRLSNLELWSTSWEDTARAFLQSLSKEDREKFLATC